MKRKYVIITIISLIIIIIIVGFSNRPIEKINCIKSGGKWKTLPDTCGDSCNYERGITQVCGAMSTRGCDCGIEKCWNGVKCETN
jgi:hypothetical protein